MFIVREAILRKNVNLKSEVIDILNINDEVEIIENNIIDKDESEIYCKVKYKESYGYVIKSSLSDEKIKLIENINEKDNDYKKIKDVSKQGKIKMINEAIRILNQNNSYSAKLDYKFYKSGKTRLNGYFNIPYYEKEIIEDENKENEQYYSYDCSAFCDTILNRVFKENMVRDGLNKIEVKKGVFKPNIWVTRDYYANAFLKDDAIKKKIKVVQYVDKFGEKIDISKMQIGDFIIGIIDKENENHNPNIHMNHIMMYFGDGYIVHASYTNGKEIFNKVLLTKLIDDFYLKIGFENRFDKNIMLARYIEK